MERAIVFTGKIEAPRGIYTPVENYQLLVGTNWIGTQFGVNSNRSEEYASICSEFADKLVKSPVHLEILTLNGHMICEDGKCRPIPRLEDSVIEQFRNTLLEQIASRSALLSRPFISFKASG